MENRLNKIIENYTTQFKDNIKNKAIELNFAEKSKVNEMLEYVYDYNRLYFTKEDFVKRKRIKNTIPTTNRCNAKRSNGQQCTRRRKVECEFCGTHSKGTPHGLISSDDQIEHVNEKIEVVAEDIKGIVYYIDKYDNVYKTEDILSGKLTPEIIAKCVNQNGTRTIPSFGLV